MLAGVHGRRVDLGAADFTGSGASRPRSPAGEAAGLARGWTDIFDGQRSAGPLRWAAPGGLRSLVRDLLEAFEVVTQEVTELPSGRVVLAMPDPQAARLAGAAGTVACAITTR